MKPIDTQMRHPYKDDWAAHTTFVDKLNDRVVVCLERAEQAFTEQERLCWDAMAEAMKMVERLFQWETKEAGEVDAEAMRRKHRELEQGFIQPLIRRFETMRTTAERELVTARVDGMQEAMQLHKSTTGIY